MEDIIKFKNINRLKSVYRENSVENRKESSAEHSWSCLILADYFLNKKDYGMNRIKVYELLMYHDLVEIESGDTPLSKRNDEDDDKSKKEREGAKRLVSFLPKDMGNKFLELFNEFEENKTKEAKFAKAIDALDAQIHEIDYKEDWAGWTEDYLRSKKEKCFEEFPELKNVFETLIVFFRKKGYFEQK